MGFFGVSDAKELETLDKEVTPTTESEVWQVALDVIESPTNLTIVAPIAGVDLDDIDVALNNGVLTISGVRNKLSALYEWEVTVRSEECFWWKFVRNIILPDNLDLDEIQASLENNILVITIKKLKFNSQNIKVDRREG